jgi:hypothetical protein
MVTMLMLHPTPKPPGKPERPSANPAIPWACAALALLVAAVLLQWPLVAVAACAGATLGTAATLIIR